MNSPTTPVTKIDEDNALLKIDRILYSDGAILRTVYDLADRCDVALTRSDDHTVAHLTRKNRDIDVNGLGAAFFSVLADHELRMQISRETNDIGILIIAQAFAEADLLDDGNQSED